MIANVKLTYQKRLDTTRTQHSCTLRMTRVPSTAREPPASWPLRWSGGTWASGRKRLSQQCCCARRMSRLWCRARVRLVQMPDKSQPSVVMMTDCCATTADLSAFVGARASCLLVCRGWLRVRHWYISLMHQVIVCCLHSEHVDIRFTSESGFRGFVCAADTHRVHTVPPRDRCTG